MGLAKRIHAQTLGAPQMLLVVTLKPVMFVILFRYVFGGAIHVPGGQSVNFLMPGIFVLTVAFGGVTTGIVLAGDSARGLLGRFRPLPLASPAALPGPPPPPPGRHFPPVVLTRPA